MGHNPEEVVEIFQCAAEESTISPMRQQQVVHLPTEGTLFVSGDLHDHRRNLEKLLSVADIENHPEHQLLLQEVVHGPHWDASGAEGSWETLLKVADLKCRFPKQVHFLLANHDLAQIHGEGIMKGGESVCKAFNKAVRRDFGERSGVVQAAITEFLLSFPLAIRTSNGLLFTHSVPADHEIPEFDYTVFDRALVGADYQRRIGPVYQLIWGRRTTPPFIDQFLDRLGAKLSVVGHQPQDMGFARNGERQLIIASDHSQGVYLQASLSDPLDLETLVSGLTKFVAIDLPVVQELPTEPEGINLFIDRDPIAAESAVAPHGNLLETPSGVPAAIDEPDVIPRPTRYDLTDELTTRIPITSVVEKPSVPPLAE